MNEWRICWITIPMPGNWLSKKMHHFCSAPSLGSFLTSLPTCISTHDKHLANTSPSPLLPSFSLQNATLPLKAEDLPCWYSWDLMVDKETSQRAPPISRAAVGGCIPADKALAYTKLIITILFCIHAVDKFSSKSFVFFTFSMGNKLPNHIHLPNPVTEEWGKSPSHMTEKQQKRASPILPSTPHHI